MKKLALFLISFAILLGSAKTSFAESDTLNNINDSYNDLYLI